MNRESNQSRIASLRPDQFAYRAVDSWPVPGPGLGKRRRMTSRTSLAPEKLYNVEEFLEPGKGPLVGLHKATACGDDAAVMNIMKIEGERHHHIMYTGLDELDVHGRSPLMYAVLSESLACMEVLLEFGALREQIDGNGRSALHYAAFYGRHRALQYLLDKATNVMARDKFGRTALHWAAMISNPKCLSVLIQYALAHRLGVDWLDDEHVTPLHVAAQFNREKHVVMLIKAGARCEIIDSTGQTALHYCLGNANVDCIQTLCSAYPSVLNAKDGSGATLLHWASAHGHAHIVAVLVSFDGCDNESRDQWSCTPAHYTCLYGNANCLQILLARGAHDYATDINGLTCLHYAVQENHLDCIHLLVSLPLASNLPDSEGHRPLTWAAALGHHNAIKSLLQNSNFIGTIDQEEEEGRTALHIASINGYSLCVRVLLESGAHIDAQDIYGSTAFHLAATQPHVKCMQELISHGADVLLRDGNGQTVLHCAVRSRFVAAVECILQNSSIDVDGIDNISSSPLHYATAEGLTDVVTCLVTGGADPTLLGLDGLSSLHLAVKNGMDVALVEALLRGTPNPSIWNADQETPLDLCFNHNQLQLADSLVSAGAMKFIEIQSLAATAIQAAFRGWRTKKSLKSKKQRKNAAVIIQSYFRGFLGRKKFKQMVGRHKAAQVIQRNYRAFVMEKRRRKELIQQRKKTEMMVLVNDFHQRLLVDKAKAKVKSEKGNGMEEKKENVIPDQMKLNQERLRMEMGLKLREKETERQEKWRLFLREEEKRREKEEKQKELAHWNGILQESKGRAKRAINDRVNKVKAHQRAACVIQAWWRAWSMGRKERKSERVIEIKSMMIQRKRAAKVIQRAWQEKIRRDRVWVKSRKQIRMLTEENAPYIRPTLMQGKPKHKLGPLRIPSAVRGIASASVPLERTKTSYEIEKRRGQKVYRDVFRPWTVLPLSKSLAQKGRAKVTLPHIDSNSTALVTQK
eukprot:m.48729 g.48729  ORF g.48729 m.48729 type:complete len:974 (+) comp33916_c0_seq2:40-2961(+)